MYLVKSPLLLKWYYPSLVWNKVRDQKVIYLTFDDGPIPDVTTFVLKTLKAFDARATFFCVGDNIVKHPDIFQNLLDDGHQVGNHTFNHLRGWATPDAEYLQNFQQCQQLTQTNLFRPPYVRIKKSQVRLIKQTCPQVQIVMWDVLSGDFDTSLTPEDCFRNVIQYTENGSIVVFHDHLKAMDRLEDTLPKVLQHFREQGYTFGLL